MKLIIGNKNYSTWSMRPWVLLKTFEVDFNEVLVSLQEPGLYNRLKQHSSSAKVPVLIDDDLSIWDSLAICEYVNERYLDNRAWPKSHSDRAQARAIAAEMHSSFTALRAEMPMNIRASRVVTPSKACLRDIARVSEIWSTYGREDSNGELRLCGEFSIADCMFAPVVMRFKTYLPEISAGAQAYCDSLSKLPAIKQWIGDALEETEILDVDEAGEDR